MAFLTQYELVVIDEALQVTAQHRNTPHFMSTLMTFMEPWNRLYAVTVESVPTDVSCLPVPGVNADAATLRTDFGHVEVC